MATSNLFGEYEIADLKARNRIVAGSVGRGLAGLDGSIPQELLDLYEALAAGGAGMIITEMTMVSARDYAIPGFLRLQADDEDVLADYRKLVETAHDHGVPILAQLAIGAYHRRTPDGNVAQVPIDEITEAEIDGIVADFASAARRARDCGFDGIELHVAHGFLLAGFLSPARNHRTDAYGGDACGRARIVSHIVEAIHAECGEDFPVLAKINGEEKTEGGLSPQQALEVCR